MGALVDEIALHQRCASTVPVSARLIAGQKPRMPASAAPQRRPHPMRCGDSANSRAQPLPGAKLPPCHFPMAPRPECRTWGVTSDQRRRATGPTLSQSTGMPLTIGCSPCLFYLGWNRRSRYDHLPAGLHPAQNRSPETSSPGGRRATMDCRGILSFALNQYAFSSGSSTSQTVLIMILRSKRGDQFST